VPALDALEGTVGGKLRNGFSSVTRGQKNKSALLDSLKKELERLGSLDAGVGVLGDDDIVGWRTTMPWAGRQAGDSVRGDNELSLLEFLQAEINRAGIVMHEKDAERTASMEKVILRAHGLEIKLGLVLGLFWHGSLIQGQRTGQGEVRGEPGSADPQQEMLPKRRRRCLSHFVHFSGRGVFDTTREWP